MYKLQDTIFILYVQDYSDKEDVEKFNYEMNCKFKKIKKSNDMVNKVRSTEGEVDVNIDFNPDDG